MNNLATVLSHQGKYERAEEMHRQILSLSKTLLGKEHPGMLTCIYCLAQVSLIENDSVQPTHCTKGH